MRIHVIGAVLGVVFQNENCGAGPETRFGDPFHQLAHGVIVIGGSGERSDLAGGGARGVVVAQAHDDQARHVAGFLVFGEFVQKDLGAIDVGIVQVKAAETGDW